MYSYDGNNIDAMKSVDIRNVDRSSLVDLNSVQIDDSQPVQDRIISFLDQIRNPYCFRIGDVVVKVNYKADGPSFQQKFEELLRTV